MLLICCPINRQEEMTNFIILPFLLTLQALLLSQRTLITRDLTTSTTSNVRIRTQCRPIKWVLPKVLKEAATQSSFPGVTMTMGSWGTDRKVRAGKGFSICPRVSALKSSLKWSHVEWLIHLSSQVSIIFINLFRIRLCVFLRFKRRWLARNWRPFNKVLDRPSARLRPRESANNPHLSLLWRLPHRNNNYRWRGLSLGSQPTRTVWEVS